MSGRHSPSWMRQYMREYRQGKLCGDIAGRDPNPHRYEALKTAQRLYSFKWRLSKLLGPQYEILLCVQYGPDYGAFKTADGHILGPGEELLYEPKKVLRSFPQLKTFKRCFGMGGGELFKVLDVVTFSNRFDRATECVVGVLDKAVLLEKLSQLPHQGGQKWEKVLDKAKVEASKGKWRPLEFWDHSCGKYLDHPSGKYLFIADQTACFSLEWTARDQPNWNSLSLYDRLCIWAMGIRGNGSWAGQEWKGAKNGDLRRVLISPIMRSDVIA
jgi:hypothetical protein